MSVLTVTRLLLSLFQLNKHLSFLPSLFSRLRLNDCLHVSRRGLRLRKKNQSEESPPAEEEEEEGAEQRDGEEEEEAARQKSEGGEGGQMDTDDCDVCPGTETSHFN